VPPPCPPDSAGCSLGLVCDVAVDSLMAVTS
jgi:hypothetical protein